MICRNRNYDEEMRKTMAKNYNIKKKGFNVVIDKREQDLETTKQNTKMHKEIVKQNRMSSCNHKQFTKAYRIKIQTQHRDQQKKKRPESSCRPYGVMRWCTTTTQTEPRE